MYPSDDFFPAIARMVAQQFQIKIVQLWAVRADSWGKMGADLQAVSCQDTTIPLSFLANSQIAAVVERAAQEQAPVSMRMVETIFPQPVAIFLKRHAAYCCIYFFLGNVVLSSVKAHVSTKEFPLPAAIVVFLFLEQPPVQNFASGLYSTLQNFFVTAAQRGLVELAPTNNLVQSPGEAASLSFSSLIPHRVEDAASSPFVFSKAGLDAPTRRFYVAINGQRDVISLVVLTNSNMEQAYTFLHTLLAQKRIKLYEPGGKAVEKLPPLKE